MRNIHLLFGLVYLQLLIYLSRYVDQKTAKRPFWFQVKLSPVINQSIKSIYLQHITEEDT